MIVLKGKDTNTESDYKKKTAARIKIKMITKYCQTSTKYGEYLRKASFNFMETNVKQSY